jgi:hypothetical protein
MYNPPGIRTEWRVGLFERLAEFNSAIQQIPNLRYVLECACEPVADRLSQGGE